MASSLSTELGIEIKVRPKELDVAWMDSMLSSKPKSNFPLWQEGNDMTL